MTVSIGRAVGAIEAREPSGGRQTTGGGVLLEQQMADEHLRVFYSMDAGDYTTEGDWTYYLHTAGGTWRSNAASGSARTFFVGADASWRANGSSWAAADYRGLGLFANAEWRPRPATTFRTGYRLDARGFPALPALNQVEHSVFGSVLVNLRSRTTVIAEVRGGLKSYNSSAMSSLATAVGAEMGAASQEATGQGRGMGPGLRGSQGLGTPYVTNNTTGLIVRPDERAGQITLLGRVAQSLTDRTGVSLQYSRRASFGDTPSVVVTTPALFFDDGVYDDPYASRADAVKATVKRVFSSGRELHAFGSWTRKDYRGTLALGIDGLPIGTDLRSDRIVRGGATLTWPLFQEMTGPLGLSLSMDYAFARHRSNDAFYRYTSHGVGVGLTVSY